MAFKKIRSVGLPYEEQAYIHYLCRTYARRSVRVQAYIRRLCDEVGGAYSDVLFKVMTTRKSVRHIAIEENLSESVIYDLRREFYTTFREDS